MRLKDKVCIVTGGGSGIGRATALLFAGEGARLLVVDKRNAQAVAAECAAKGAQAIAVEADVAVGADVKRVMETTVERFRRLDVLVNNAGLDLHDDLSDRAGLDRHLTVNLFGTYGVTQAFLPLLARSRGAIVNVLSLAALAGLPFTPAYSIPKAAALSLTQSLRALWAGRGVRVHASSPVPWTPI